MDIRKVKKLIELLEESGIAEIEIKEGEEAVRISRMPTGNAAMQHYAPQALPQLPPAGPMSPAQAAAAAGAGNGTGAASSAAASLRPNEHVVTAPMVGTYYAAPSPGAKPFVNIGGEVKTGQVLCIIEAMKMMNQIESDKDGKVTSIMCKNGDPVEFGQPLFVIE
jgi:acetyl-CoA carboxylase biotin carboxyl carrier protein